MHGLWTLQIVNHNTSTVIVICNAMDKHCYDVVILVIVLTVTLIYLVDKIDMYTTVKTYNIIKISSLNVQTMYTFFI